MGVVTARLVFLAFLGLTGTIIYNALYLQEHGPKGAATTAATTTARKVASESETISVQPLDEPSGLEVPPPPEHDVPVIEEATAPVSLNAPPVSTDLPPLAPETGESQLVVRAVQRELAARGYDVGPVDGNLSGKTRAAISAFQTKEGLAVTGAPSDDLLRQILLGDSIAPSAATGSVAASDSIAANAAEHDTVKGVQQVLADLGYAPGPVDGAWGENTARAVTAFQRDHGIPETGQITPELLDEFQRVTGHDLTKTAAHP
jgi:peptidoglycan hydrolase-like protein with peptidoglycan-binding domain